MIRAFILKRSEAQYLDYGLVSENNNIAPLESAPGAVFLFYEHLNKYFLDCVNLSNSEFNLERGMLLEKKRIIH